MCGGRWGLTSVPLPLLPPMMEDMQVSLCVALTEKPLSLTSASGLLLETLDHWAPCWTLITSPQMQREAAFYRFLNLNQTMSKLWKAGSGVAWEKGRERMQLGNILPNIWSSVSNTVVTWGTVRIRKKGESVCRFGTFSLLITEQSHLLDYFLGHRKH